jgi:hypothetical protein
MANRVLINLNANRQNEEWELLPDFVFFIEMLEVQGLDS